MNASRGLRSLAILVLATMSRATSQVAWAGDAQPNHGAPPKAKTLPGKTDPATKTIAGRVFDAHGKPLADASVWLIRQDDSNFMLPKSTVIAEAQSRADGRFDLRPLVADLKKHADDPYAGFEIWVWKRGLALGHGAFFGEPVPQPINIFLVDEVPFVVRLKTPKGAPCEGASVAPVVATFGYSRVIPKPLQDRLKTKSAPDGHADIHGLDGRLKGLSIEKPEFGTQVLLLSDRAASPLVATVHDTRSLEGRLIFPKGERVDPSQATLRVQLASERMTPCKDEPKDGVDSPLFAFWQEFSPTVDRDGRFRISGVLAHGSGRFHVWGLPDIPLVFAPSAPTKSPKPHPANEVLKVEIPLIRGIWCNVLVRDAQTKKPLSGVGFVIASKRVVDQEIDCDEDVVLPDSDSTDSQGRIRLRVRPGETYRAYCGRCEGYFDWSANNSVVDIPAGVDRFEMPPIELARECAIKGRLVDADGNPLTGVSILGVWSAGAQHQGKATTNALHWTTTDSAGLFRFEEVAGGTHVTLLPARGGVPIGDPVKTVAGDDKPVDLKTGNEDLVALSGRVLGLDHKPVAAAPLLVEIENLSGAATFVPVQTGADGAFHTPARFLKRLKYRLIARLLLDVVGSSDWMCPAIAGTTFADFSVDATRLRIGIRLTGDEVVARVNGEPIRAREILEWPSIELPPEGRKLADANDALATGKITDREFRVLQDKAIDKYTAEFARTRLQAQAFLALAEPDQCKALEGVVDKELADYGEQLKTYYHLNTTDEVDRKLRQRGSSLASIRAVWRHRLMASEYSRADRFDSDVVWSKALASYKAHADRYLTPKKVAWQLIEASFYKPAATIANASTNQTDTGSASSNASPDLQLTAGNSQTPTSAADSRTDTGVGEAFERATKLELPPDPADSKPSPSSSDESKSKASSTSSPHQGERYVGKSQARPVLERALERLRKGEPFEAVAKKFSEGPGAEHGGWQTPVRPESLADEKTAAALRKLPEGAISSIIETDDSLRIVRVVSRIPASVQPFDEVEEAIRQSVLRELQKKQWHALLARSSIELPFQPPPDLPVWYEGEVPAER